MDNILVHPAQHGFLKNRSTCTNLLESLNDWTVMLRDNDAVTVVYIDFCKALDTVLHPKLIAKLNSYGILAETYCRGSRNKLTLMADHTVHALVTRIQYLYRC